MEIKKSDVNLLAAKLGKFAESLPEQEQNVLNWVLARAKAASEVEVTDTDLDLVSGGLADAAGFESEMESVSVGVRWTR